MYCSPLCIIDCITILTRSSRHIKYSQKRIHIVRCAGNWCARERAALVLFAYATGAVLNYSSRHYIISFDAHTEPSNKEVFISIIITTTIPIQFRERKSETAAGHCVRDVRYWMEMGGASIILLASQLLTTSTRGRSLFQQGIHPSPRQPGERNEHIDNTYTAAATPPLGRR